MDTIKYINKENKEQYDIPVVMIVYKRLEAVKKSFVPIKELRPKKLYVISDGPRNENEKEKVEEVRRYIEDNIDWNCDLHKDYAEKNLGLRYRMPTGMAAVFRNEEFAVFIEDDIHATKDFFIFCKDMLEKYKDNEQIMMISGSNILSNDKSFGNEDICFSYFASIWGWATWKRAFEGYDVNIKKWVSFKRKGYLKKVLTSNAYQFYSEVFDDLQYHWYKTWDYQWKFHVISNHGLGIVPRVNLVNNIGMGDPEGEHPDDTAEMVSYVSNLKCEKINIPINYSKPICRNTEYDTAYQNWCFKKKYSFFHRVKYGIRARYYEWIYRKIKKLENNDEYYNNVLEERYKLSEIEQKNNNGDKYRLITAKDMRKSAWKYIIYMILHLKSL